MDTTQKLEINIKNSINTDTLEEDFKAFDDASAPLIKNTGIERDGGVTNIYEKKTTYSEAGQYVLTEDGKTISLVDSATADYKVIKIDGIPIGQCSSYGVESQINIAGVEDIFLTATSYVTCSIVSNIITISEYSYAQVLLNTRNVTFTNLAAVMPFYTSLSFVRYNGQAYADSQEWGLRLGPQIVILKESTPGQTLLSSISATNVLGAGESIYACAVYNNQLVVGGTLGRVASFDGVSWKNYDGTGTGTGPYNAGTAVGATSTILSVTVYNGLLAITGGARVASWNGAVWTNYNAGSGFCSDGTAMGSNLIYTSAVYGTRFVVGGVASRVASWDGAAWTNYNAGAGLCNNGTALGAGIFNCKLAVYNTLLVYAGDSGRLASWNGTAWTNYNAGAGLCNNGTAIGAEVILGVCQYGTRLAIGGGQGRVASWSGTAWTNYNAGAGLCNNGTVVGAGVIYSMSPFAGKLVVSGGSGLIGSWDGAAWTNYNAGSGLCNPGTIIGATIIREILPYGSQLAVTGQTPIVNTMASDGSFVPFYTEGGVFIGNLLVGSNNKGYLYTYRYENGEYLILLVGNSAGKAFTLNSTTNAIITIKARYAMPQVSANKSRHIVTSTNIVGSLLYDATNIKATGLVGYTDFVTYSGAVVYPPAVVTLGNGFVLQSAAGFGYSDFTYRTSGSATDVFNYVSQFRASTTNLYQLIQSNSNTLINAYGKLNNNYNMPSTKPFEFRVGMLNGVMSFLSVALLDGIASDALGTLITNVGEFDDTYTPLINGDDIILYSYGGRFNITKIGKTNPSMIQQIETGIYKINSISPLNIIDTKSQTLEIGSVDYNNRMIFTSTVAPGVSSKIASVITGKYSNSVDTGDKLVTINPATSANIEIVGYRIPVVSTNVGSYEVDTYIQDIYSFSTLNDGSELVDSFKSDTVYAAQTILPISLAVEYGTGTATINGSTIFLKPSYDGYSIGNDIPGEYLSFVLFGQLYLFDGANIYAANVDATTGVFNSKVLVTGAAGLQYLASSPTMIYFLSTYDNAIFTFSGGRNLDKFKRMNKMPTILSGIFSVRDNTLLMDTATSFIWVRDGVITENIKAVDQTSLKYYATNAGLVIGNNSFNWKYTYTPLSGSTVVPLTLQTPYFGLNLNELSILSAWVVTIYNAAKGALTIQATLYAIDGDISREQVVNWVVNPKDYNNGGYARLRVQPQNQRSLGASLKMVTTSKIVLVSILPEFVKAESATVALPRSR